MKDFPIHNSHNTIVKTRRYIRTKVVVLCPAMDPSYSSSELAGYSLTIDVELSIENGQIYDENYFNSWLEHITTPEKLEHKHNLMAIADYISQSALATLCEQTTGRNVRVEVSLGRKSFRIEAEQFLEPVR